MMIQTTQGLLGERRIFLIQVHFKASIKLTMFGILSPPFTLF